MSTAPMAGYAAPVAGNGTWVGQDVRLASQQATERRRDIAFFGAWLIVAASGDNLRAFGGLLYVASIAALIYSALPYYRKGLARWPLVFMSVVGFYGALSFAHLLPHGWTRYYDRSVIPNQMISVFGFGLAVVASHRWWDRVNSGHIHRRWLIYIALTGMVLGVAIDSAILGRIEFARATSTLRNSTLAFFLIVSYLAALGRGRWSWSILALAVLMIVTRKVYMQTVLIILVFFAFQTATLLRLRVGQIATAALVILVLSATIIGFRNEAAAFQIDPNTGWRLLFWHDVLRSTQLTWGGGVGFGPEALFNYYPEMMKLTFITNEMDNDNFLLIGTHNGFSDTLYRTGAIGLLALLAIVWTSRPTKQPTIAFSNQMGFVFCAAFMCLYTNVALQSPLYAVGIALVFGYTRSFNYSAQTGTPLYYPATRAADVAQSSTGATAGATAASQTWAGSQAS